MELRKKHILITAGPTWVPIDSVRVISNIATAETGIILAQKLLKLGAKVTLLMGPVGTCCLDKKIKIINFKFIDELKRLIIKELTSRKYDIVIHSAAVADYKPQTTFKRKVKSGIKQLRLNLVPTPKIIDLIKKIDRNLFLIGFKFEPKASRRALIKQTKSLMSRANLDLAVANTIDKNRYSAFIVNNRQLCGPIFNKKNMAEKLIRLIGEQLCKN